MLVLVIAIIIVVILISTISHIDKENDNLIDISKIRADIQKKQSECFDFDEMFSEINGVLVKIKRISSERIAVAGIHIGRRKNVCTSCYRGEELDLIRNPNNKFDKNAIKIMRRKSGISSFGFNYGIMGHIPANIACQLSPKMKNGAIFKAFFESFEGRNHYSYYNAYIILVEFKEIHQSD